MNAPWVTLTQPKPEPTNVPDETLLKDRFAEALLRMPHDAYRAATVVFGADTLRALKVAQTWIYDPYIMERQAALLRANGENEYLPGKAELARRVFDVGEKATDAKDRLAAYKLYAEIRGFVQKDQINNNNVFNLTQNRVMVLRDFGTDDQWETKAAVQQAKLIEHSRD